MMENNIAYELADAGSDLDKSWQLITRALEPAVRLVCSRRACPRGDKCTAPLRKLAFMLDTAGWILYRQGKTKEAEPYLRSSYAITPRGETELHMVDRAGQIGPARRGGQPVRTGTCAPGFDRVDSRETMRELVKAAGGDAELDELLGHARFRRRARRSRPKRWLLVDGTEKYRRASGRAGSPDLAEVAKSLTLPVLSWPGTPSTPYGRSSSADGDQWVASEAYVGETPPPTAVRA